MNTEMLTAKKQKHLRKSALNYWTKDIDFLLDTVAHREPHSKEDWEIVTADFNNWADRNKRPTRSLESLKDKFDKLAYVRKRTGDPTIHPHVRKAKLIYQDNQAKALSKALGSADGNMNPAEEYLQKARKEGNISGVRRPREESDNSAAQIEEIIPVPSRNQPSQQKKRQKPSINLPLERKLQLDVVRHMEMVTSSMLSVADAIHKSLFQRAAPPRDDLRTIIKEKITAALSSDHQKAPAALPFTSLPVSEANPFRAFASRSASNRDHKQS